MPAECATPLRPSITPEEIVRALRHLPSAPKVLPRLKILLRDGNSALDEIVSLVRLDPGLAARTLQIANSPYFFTGARCLTVEDAVGRVGYERVYQLVSHAVGAQALNRPLAAYGIEADELWARGVGCALAADAIAERVGEDRAVAYTLGLLHGVGMIAVDEWALHGGHDLLLAMRSFPDEAIEDERAALGCTNAEVGAVLLRQWEFPTEIIEPIQFQYAAHTATRHARLAALLFAAKWMRDQVRGADFPRGALPATPIRALGLSPAAVGDLVPAVTHHFTLVSCILDEVKEELGTVVVDRQLFPSQAWQR